MTRKAEYVENIGTDHPLMGRLEALLNEWQADSFKHLPQQSAESALVNATVNVIQNAVILMTQRALAMPGGEEITQGMVTHTLGRLLATIYDEAHCPACLAKEIARVGTVAVSEWLEDHPAQRGETAH